MFLADTTIRRNVALGVPEDEIDQALVTEAIRLAQLEDFVASLQEGLDSVVGQRECASRAASANVWRSRVPSIGGRVS